MHIVNNPAFLLFIEPEKASENPIVDVYTRKITAAFRKTKEGVAPYRQELPWFTESQAYKGIHLCTCGHASSSNRDHLLEALVGERISVFSNSQSFNEGCEDDATIVQGLITNSLCIHYVACHRSEVPSEQLEKILYLGHGEVQPTAREIRASGEVSLPQSLLEGIPKMGKEQSELYANLISFCNGPTMRFGHEELATAWEVRSKEMNWGDNYRSIPSLLRKRGKELQAQLTSELGGYVRTSGNDRDFEY